MQESIIPIKEIEINEKIYPRVFVNESLIQEYAIQIKKKNNFPPIYVGLYKGKKILVDGRHRLEALKVNGEKYATCNIQKFISVGDLLLSSIKANLKHGRRLTNGDKIKVAKTMRDMKFDIEGIKDITGLNDNLIEKITRSGVNKLSFSVGGGVIRDKIKEKESIKVIDDKEELQLEIKNRLNWQIDELKNIYNYFKKTEIFTDNKKVTNLVSNIKQTLKKKYPKL